MTIDLHNIQFSYPETPEHLVLNIPQWSVNSGEHLFLYGPSGCGKSTLLNVLSGMQSVHQGEVSILGKRLDKMKGYQRDQFRANHIGYVFQQFNLIPYLNPVENLRLSLSFTRQKTVLNVSDDHIQEQLDALQIGRSLWKKASEKLSIGQQQRVAIARAFIHKPELIIADEPTSSLDHKNRDNFMHVLMELAERHNITLVFVSHDMALSNYFKRIDSFVEINSTGDNQ